MSNSPLVVYTKLSLNCNKPRNHTIDTISIHCMAGNCTVETCGEIFSPTSRQASSNYGIGSDGRIALYVDEANRSWCTSSGANDHRAVTIEVANDEGDPTWHISDKALAALINLCADICQRNGIKKLLWKADKNLIGQTDKQNMSVHRWFANKSCPGDYLYSKHPYIADEVNKRLGAASSEPESPTTGTIYRVQCGAFSQRANADALEAKLKAAGYETYMVTDDGLYKVQTGAFSKKANADNLESELKAKGFDTFITTKAGAPAGDGSTAPSEPAPKNVAKGSAVRLKKGTKTYTGGGLSSFVYDRNHIVSQLEGDRAVITYNDIVVAAVHASDLTVQ